jgi:chemotaxis response regulator CheB
MSISALVERRSHGRQSRSTAPKGTPRIKSFAQKIAMGTLRTLIVDTPPASLQAASAFLQSCFAAPIIAVSKLQSDDEALQRERYRVGQDHRPRVQVHAVDEPEQHSGAETYQHLPGEITRRFDPICVKHLREKCAGGQNSSNTANPRKNTVHTQSLPTRLEVFVKE